MPTAGVETLLDRASPDSTNAPLLEVENLHVRFETSRGTVRAVEGISYTVNRGEIVAIVGESGCGKSVSSLAIMRLLAKTGRVTRARSRSTAATCSRSRPRRCARSAAATSR